MLCVGGLDESHREKMLMAMLPKSVRRCAASVMMARLPAAYPPAKRGIIIPAYFGCFDHFTNKWEVPVSVNYLAAQRTTGWNKEYFRIRRFGVSETFVGSGGCPSYQSPLRSWRRSWRRRRWKVSSWPNVSRHFVPPPMWGPSPGRAGLAATGRPHWRHHHSALMQSLSVSPVLNLSWERIECSPIGQHQSQFEWFNIKNKKNVPVYRLQMSVNQALFLWIFRKLHTLSDHLF